jgi:hypothetical protein
VTPKKARIETISIAVKKPARGLPNTVDQTLPVSLLIPLSPHLSARLLLWMIQRNPLTESQQTIY